jgi:hydrogenase maturation protease
MSDDQAGLIVAERLRRRRLPDTTILQTESPLTEFVDEAGDPVELLIVIDAAPANERHPPGSVFRLDYRERADVLTPKSRTNTHTLSVDAGLELADALGLLPARVWLYVVFGEAFDRGANVSRAVAEALDRLDRRIADVVEEWLELRACRN